MNNNKISIIIPAFNAEKHLAETIESIMRQTYSNWELIIINDGSTDSTGSIAKHYSKTDKRITYVEQQNQGVSAARNNGYKISSGDFIAFPDADDVWLPENLNKKMQYFFSDELLGLVHSDMEIIDTLSQPIGTVLQGKEGFVMDELLLWSGCVIPSPSSILIKKEVIENTGLFDLQLSTAADQDFFIRIAAKNKVGRVKEILGLYRIHDNNMHKNIALMEHDHLLVYKKAHKNKFFKSFRFRQQCFSNMYLTLAGSWWVNGNNKFRGLYFIFKSVLAYPPHITKLLNKLF